MTITSLEAVVLRLVMTFGGGTGDDKIELMLGSIVGDSSRSTRDDNLCIAEGATEAD